MIVARSIAIRCTGVLSLFLCFVIATTASAQLTDRIAINDDLRSTIAAGKEAAKEAYLELAYTVADSTSETEAAVDQQIAAIDRRISTLAYATHQVNAAVAAGRSKKKILTLLRTDSGELPKTLTHNDRSSDTQRMLDRASRAHAGPEPENPADVENQFCEAMLKLGSELANANIRKLELEQEKRKLANNETISGQSSVRLLVLLKKFDAISNEILNCSQLGHADADQDNRTKR